MQVIRLQSCFALSALLEIYDISGLNDSRS